MWYERHGDFSEDEYKLVSVGEGLQELIEAGFDREATRICALIEALKDQYLSHHPRFPREDIPRVLKFMMAKEERATFGLCTESVESKDRSLYMQ
jgi:hypothetical protein